MFGSISTFGLPPRRLVPTSPIGMRLPRARGRICASASASCPVMPAPPGSLGRPALPRTRGSVSPAGLTAFSKICRANSSALVMMPRSPAVPGRCAGMIGAPGVGFSGVARRLVRSPSSGVRSMSGMPGPAVPRRNASSEEVSAFCTSGSVGFRPNSPAMLSVCPVYGASDGARAAPESRAPSTPNPKFWPCVAGSKNWSGAMTPVPATPASISRGRASRVPRATGLDSLLAAAMASPARLTPGMAPAALDRPRKMGPIPTNSPIDSVRSLA